MEKRTYTIKNYGLSVNGTLVMNVISRDPKTAREYFKSNYNTMPFEIDPDNVDLNGSGQWKVTEIKAREKEAQYYYDIREIEAGKRYTDNVLTYSSITRAECVKRLNRSDRLTPGKAYRIVELTEYAERDVAIFIKPFPKAGPKITEKFTV